MTQLNKGLEIKYAKKKKKSKGWFGAIFWEEFAVGAEKYSLLLVQVLKSYGTKQI